MDNEERSSEHLPVPSSPFTVLPGGGLALFSQFEYSFGDESSVQDLVQASRIKTAEQALFLVLLYSRMQEDQRGYNAVNLVKEFLRLGIFVKEHVLHLYRMQSEHVRIHSPIFSFEVLAGLTHEEKHVLSFDDLVSLACEFKLINSQDVHHLMYRFYDKENELPYELLKAWHDDCSTKKHPKMRLRGKEEALVALALYERKPEDVPLDEALERMRDMSRREPGSHGIPRYLSLCWHIAGEDQGKQERVIDEIAQIINASITPGYGCNAYEASTLLGWILEDAAIPVLLRLKLERRVERYAQEIGKYFSNLVADLNTPFERDRNEQLF